MTDKTSTRSRRNFLASSGSLLVGTAALGGIINANAMEKHHHGSGDGMEVDASMKDMCGTCRYWGGMRKVSDDKKKVIAQSMGWCNNPDSMNHQKLTAADHKMKKPGIWKKWDVL